MSTPFFFILFTLIILCNTPHPQAQNYGAVEIPNIACPEYFQYLQFGPQLIGKLTLPSMSGDIELVIFFSQRLPLETNYYGKISLFEDRITTANRIRNRQPITYRIEFPNPNELPKLTRLSVNGQDLCVSDDYPLPSTRLYLNHKLQSNAGNKDTGNFVSYQGNPANPILAQPSVPVAVSRFEEPAPVSTSRPFVQSSECGVDSGISAFIYGGEQITRGQFPWLTAIYVKSAGLRFLCGGSLVSRRTVISAGHCFKLGGLTAKRLVVNVGRHNLEDYSEQNFQTREIQNLIVHPEYERNVFPDADLAILHLQQPVQFTDFIRPICLWAESADSSLIVGLTGVIAGWGADESGRPFSPLPKKSTANIVSDSECLRSSATFSRLTSPRTLCAGNRDGTGPCMGDSGSGLMINRYGQWFLRGVVSAGQTKQDKCNLFQYVVYCDVAKHMQWLQSNIIT